MGTCVLEENLGGNGRVSFEENRRQGDLIWGSEHAIQHIVL